MRSPSLHYLLSSSHQPDEAVCSVAKASSSLDIVLSQAHPSSFVSE